MAFQITNILRDVGEDAEQRGRVYLPQQDMKQFGVTEQQLFDKRVDENYINLMKFEIARDKPYDPDFVAKINESIRQSNSPTNRSSTIPNY